MTWDDPAETMRREIELELRTQEWAAKMKKQKRARRREATKDIIRFSMVPLIVVIIVVGVPVLLCWLLLGPPNGGGTDTGHYNNDFKRFCEQLGGKAFIDDYDICTVNGKVVMHESNWHGVADWRHYNDDFARYCRERGGTPTIQNHDICIRDDKLIMRES